MHFLDSFKDYLNSIVDQANDRDSSAIKSIETYFINRRQNIGARPSFAVGELRLNIPDEIFYHPLLKELEYCITDLLILDNVSSKFHSQSC
jgi:hypothetical protein